MGQVFKIRRDWGVLPPYVEPLNGRMDRLKYRRKVPLLARSVLGTWLCHTLPRGITVEQARSWSDVYNERYDGVIDDTLVKVMAMRAETAALRARAGQ